MLVWSLRHILSWDNLNPRARPATTDSGHIPPGCVTTGRLPFFIQPEKSRKATESGQDVEFREMRSSRAIFIDWVGLARLLLSDWWIDQAFMGIRSSQYLARKSDTSRPRGEKSKPQVGCRADTAVMKMMTSFGTYRISTHSLGVGVGAGVGCGCRGKRKMDKLNSACFYFIFTGHILTQSVTSH
jgi:hypothetical protein